MRTSKFDLTPYLGKTLSLWHGYSLHCQQVNTAVGLQHYKSVVTTFEPGSAFTTIVGPIPVVNNAKSLMKRSAAAA